MTCHQGVLAPGMGILHALVPALAVGVSRCIQTADDSAHVASFRNTMPVKQDITKILSLYISAVCMNTGVCDAYIF